MTQSQSQTTPSLPTSLQSDVVFDASFLDFLIDFRLKSEPQSELYNFHARFYDPEIGRFISHDAAPPSLEQPLSLNRYSYVINNPLKYIDPDGNFHIDSTGKFHIEPRYGNYAGGGWTGGSLNVDLPESLWAPPVDNLDATALTHDKLYGEGKFLEADKLFLEELWGLDVSVHGVGGRRPDNPLHAYFYRAGAIAYFSSKVFFVETYNSILDFFAPEPEIIVPLAPIE